MPQHYYYYCPLDKYHMKICKLSLGCEHQRQPWSIEKKSGQGYGIDLTQIESIKTLFSMFASIFSFILRAKCNSNLFGCYCSLIWWPGVLIVSVVNCDHHEREHNQRLPYGQHQLMAPKIQALNLSNGPAVNSALFFLRSMRLSRHSSDPTI